MSEHFDPYHRWLGIPPRHRPADHYRLLGIDRFENDPEVIADAAERQTSHVRRYQHGPHSDLSQRVLNELATANACLLDPDEKAEYDRKLRESLVGQEPAVDPVPPLIVASSVRSEASSCGNDAGPPPASPRTHVGAMEPAIGASRAVQDPRLAEHFDPHHRWLGISPKHQPADYYRLLGLERFEDDLEVISDAAERQITHVRSYQLGPHSVLSQQILNELAAAKACLLTPAKKAEYDGTLREQVAAQEQAVPPPAPRSPAVLPPVVVPPQARPEVAEGGKEIPAPPPVVDRSERVNRAWWSMEVRPHVLRIAIMAGAAVGGILLGLVLFLVWSLFTGGEGPEVADGDAGTAFVGKGLDGEGKPRNPTAADTQPKTSKPADPAPADPGLAIQPAVPRAVEPTAAAESDRTPADTETPDTEAKATKTSETADSSQPSASKPAGPSADPAAESGNEPSAASQVSVAAKPAAPPKPTPMASEAPQKPEVHAFAELTEFSVEVVVGGDPNLRRSKFATGLGILAGLMRSTLQASVEVIDLKVVEESDRAVMIVVVTPSVDWPYLVLNLAAELKCMSPNGGEAVVVWSANSQSNWKDAARGVCRLDAARLDAHKDPIIRNAMVLDFHKVWVQSGVDFFRPLGVDHRAARTKLDALPGLAPAVQGLEPTLPSDNTQSVEPELTNSIGMRLALVPAGEFMMGSPDS